LHRYETRPKAAMNPPNVAQTMLKLTTARVGILQKVEILCFSRSRKFFGVEINGVGLD
jgi:hypothetical protein